MGLIVGKDSNAILTMEERSTNFLIMEKLKYGKKAMLLAKTVWRLLLPYMGEHLKTITTDSMSGLNIGWHWISISRMHTLHGKKELSRTPTSLLGCIFPKGTDIIRNIALAG